MNRSVTIVGSGITGLGAAYYFGKSNISYVVLEAKSDLGGVWNSQRWHGARCDSDIIKYSFSFKPWLSDQSLRSRADIHAYLRSVAMEFGIEENIRFNTRVHRAVFDTRAKQWRIFTNRGTFTSQFLLNGNGYMSETPHVPAFEGTDEFNGEIIHTSDLDDRRRFEDKRVVVVGSGATAVCCAPVLADVSKSLVMLQRSPSYIYEVTNKIGPLTRLSQQLHRRGITSPVKLVRYGLQLKDDLIFVGFRRFPGLGKWIFRRHWSRAVEPRMLKQHFSPRYKPWEQRIPVAIGFKERIRKNTIVMKTGEIERFTRDGIVLTCGETIAADVCILATGFNLDFLKFDLLIDDARVSLDRINFYKGVIMGSIPNYFQPVGVWHSAWTQRSESVTKLAVEIIEYMKVNGFGAVSIPRKTVAGVPTITPGYMTRHSQLPRIYGSLELPALDQLLSYRFTPAEFQFS
jgi:monooxygenase